jgi:hypothetical protein
MSKLRKQFQKKSWTSSGHKLKQGKSMTLPDQNLTITQLLDRHSRGVSLGAPQKTGEYFDTDIPRHDDLLDVLNHKKELDRKVKEMENNIKQTKLKNKSIKEKSEDKVSQAETVAKPTEK